MLLIDDSVKMKFDLIIQVGGSRRMVMLCDGDVNMTAILAVTNKVKVIVTATTVIVRDDGDVGDSDDNDDNDDKGDDGDQRALLRFDWVLPGSGFDCSWGHETCGIK